MVERAQACRFRDEPWLSPARSRASAKLHADGASQLLASTQARG